MSYLSFYILRQMITPFIIITLALSGIIWMVRAIRLLDTVVLSGQNLSLWLELWLYTAPNILVLVLPPAVLLALFYSFYKLFLDSEIIAMFSVGISKWRIMRPALWFSFALAGMILILELYAAPWANRQLQSRALEINANIANAMLRPGLFTSPISGITAFIRKRDKDGQIYGIFFQDQRDPDKLISYTAQSGTLVRNQGRVELIMFNGHVQHYDRKAEKTGITLVKFDRYSYNLTHLSKPDSSNTLKLNELYPHQIFNRINDDDATPTQRRDATTFAHKIALNPLYIIAYALLALAIFLPAQINRGGYKKRIIIAIIIALAMRFSSFVFANLSADHILYLLAAYLIPLITSVITLWVILRNTNVIYRIRYHFAHRKALRQASASSDHNSEHIAGQGA